MSSENSSPTVLNFAWVIRAPLPVPEIRDLMLDSLEATHAPPIPFGREGDFELLRLPVPDGIDIVIAVRGADEDTLAHCVFLFYVMPGVLETFQSINRKGFGHLERALNRLADTGCILERPVITKPSLTPPMDPRTN